MGLGFAGRRNRVEEQVECTGEIADIVPGERGGHPVHDLGDEGGAVKPVSAQYGLAAGQETIGHVPQGRQEETTRIAHDVGEMMDGKRHVGRDQQKLTAPAEKGFSVDVGEHLAFQQEQEGITRQGGTWNLCRFYGELGLDAFDEQSLL